MSQYYQQISTHCLDETKRKHVEALCDRLADYEQDMAHQRDANVAPITALCRKRDDLTAINALAANIRKRFRHVIICGSGGSGLSGKVLSGLNLYSDAPTLYTLDNIDPDAIEKLLQRCLPKETCIITISKSGETAETLTQFFAFYAHFQATLGQETAEHFIVITIAADSPLRRFANAHDITTLEHPTDIGGRFSLFTPVGMLPAAISGLSIEDFRSGAESVVDMIGTGIHPARLGASLQYAAMEAGHNMSVMLPYCERLWSFSIWYRQVWSESLGKQGRGTTPIPAMGTTDQHSQLQLYLDGPDDKFFTLIAYNRAGKGLAIKAPDDPELDYLRGKKIGDVMEAEQRVTIETLVQHSRPVRIFELQRLDEKTLGALLMHFMLETFFMGRLLGVNAFDQPAVQMGKIMAHRYLLGDTP